MRSVWGAITFFGLLLGGSHAQVCRLPMIQPTPLESFATMPATHIAWSTEIGRLNSTESHLVVTALILEDTAQPPDRMRGVRLDLRNQDSQDQLYLDEETLAAYIKDLDEISRYAKKFPSGFNPKGTNCLGARQFWYGDKTPSVHALEAMHCVTPNSSWLAVYMIGGHAHLRFPHQDASQLSALIAKALDELKSR